MKKELSPQQVMQRFIFGYQTTQAIYAAVALGIPEHIGSEPTPLSEIAEAAGCCQETLARLLRALVSRGIFAEVEEGLFKHSILSECLRAESPTSLRAVALYQGLPCIWAAWGALKESVTNGKSGFKNALGCEFFEYLDSHPDSAEAFNGFMASAQLIEGLVANEYDFTKHEIIADIGGGHGGLLRSVLSRAPDAGGILFEQAAVIENIKKSDGIHWDRIHLCSGNFFETLPEADAYLFKMILHDWADIEVIKILTNCRRSMRQDGRVLIIESPIPDGAGASAARFSDLMMLATTGGKERTLSEYSALLSEAGFRLVQEIQLKSTPPMSIIVAAIV